MKVSKKQRIYFIIGQIYLAQPLQATTPCIKQQVFAASLNEDRWPKAFHARLGSACAK